jgi:hypothetical protein
MEALDITDNGLREKGYAVKKEGYTIALYYNDSLCTRSTIYKTDWSRTVAKAEKEFKQNSHVDDLTLQEVINCMASNYSKIMNGAATEAAKPSALSSIQLEMPPLLSAEKLGVEITSEKWLEELMVKHQKLKDTIQNSSQPLPQLSLPLEFALSVKNILNIQDCTLPFAGILLGVPSSLKTVAVELFRPYWHGKYTDDFSPKGFVSHYGGVPEENLQKIDLLPQIRYKFFLTPELAPLFTGNEDDLKKAFGNLTRILDGKGFQSHSGTQGARGYYGEYMFTWLGAAVDVSPRVHRMMGNLGPKMYFLRLPKVFKKEKDIVQQLKNPKFTADLTKIQQALFEYLKWFEACPMMDIAKTSGLPKIVWDSDKDDIKAIRQIARLSLLIAHLRGVVDTWETQGTQGSDYAYAPPIIEEPDRAATQLYNLARGHALIEGRNYLTMADIPLLVKVVLSTAPIGRATVFDLLLQKQGKLLSSDIRTGLQFSRPTVLRAMTELMVLGLVDDDQEGDHDNSPKSIELKDQFRWCLGRTFRQLREGFAAGRKSSKQAPFGKRSSKQGDNAQEDFTERKEKSGSVTHNIVFPSSFWVFYNNLENQKQTEGPEGAVSESKLKQELISSGMFTAGDAAQLIREAIESGRVTRSGFDVLIKNSQFDMSKNEQK